MEYIYAALLLHKLKQPISEDNVKKVVSAAGTNPDDVRVKALVSALSEVNIDDALKSAMTAPVAVAPAPAAGTASAQGAPAAKPQEEEKAEEKKEEQALEGLSSLFG